MGEVHVLHRAQQKFCAETQDAFNCRDVNMDNKNKAVFYKGLIDGEVCPCFSWDRADSLQCLVRCYALALGKKTVIITWFCF